MTQIAWDPTLATGNELVDAQHKSLFRLLDELNAAIAEHGDDTENAVTNAVYALTDYVVEHFTDEQVLMAQRGYPGLDSHIALHKGLTNETMQIAARFFNGDDVDPAELVVFVDTWLRDHIRTQDFRFAEFCRAQ